MKFSGSCRRRSTHPALIALNLGSGSSDSDQVEFQKRLLTLKAPQTDILGKNYTPKNRHKIPPTNIKQKMVQNQCIVYASLPYSDLLAVKEQSIPPILAKKQWEKSASNAKSEHVKFKHPNRMQRERSGIALSRGQSVVRTSRTQSWLITKSK